MIALHDDSAWQPSTPSARLLREPFSGAAWRRYLRAEGYSSDEVDELLAGVRGDDRHPGLPRAVREGLALRTPDDRGDVAVAGLVVHYLERRPPLTVLDLSPAPPRYLSPEDLGRRLVAIDQRVELGALHRDRITGALWVVAIVPPRDRPRMVTSSALYDCVGIAAVRWRLVEIDGAPALAAREPLHWHALERGDHSEDLDRQRPADVWIANGRIPRGVRKRLHPIPGLPPLLRWDLGDTLGSDPRLEPTSAHLPMLRAITRVADSKLRRCVQVSGLTGDAAAELYGLILTRRETLRGQLDRLTGRSAGR